MLKISFRGLFIWQKTGSAWKFREKIQANPKEMRKKRGIR